MARTPYAGYLSRKAARANEYARAMRCPTKYWVVSDPQLSRDLKGRTIADVYRENRAGGDTTRYTPYYPRDLNDRSLAYCAERRCDGHGANAGRTKTHPKPLMLSEEYEAWCKSRKHTPHPASIDPDHPHNAHRLRAPKRETV